VPRLVHRRSLILLSTPPIAGAVALALVLTASRIPTYQGIGIDKYLPDLALTGPPGEKARDAFANLGTNAVPFLRRSLQAKDTLPKRALLRLLDRQPFLKIPLRPAVQTQRLALLAYDALVRSVQDGREPPALADACTEDITELAMHSDQSTSLIANDTLRRAAAAKLEAATLAQRYANKATPENRPPTP
jgi:hypothetical protein